MAYAKDCETVFGYFMHHFPYFGIYGKEDYQQLVTAFDKTCALSRKTHFGFPINRRSLPASETALKISSSQQASSYIAI